MGEQRRKCRADGGREKEEKGSEDGRWSSEVELVERKGYSLAGKSRNENNRAIK